jgi:hypothetical protein
MRFTGLITGKPILVMWEKTKVLKACLEGAWTYLLCPEVVFCAFVYAFWEMGYSDAGAMVFLAECKRV